MSSGDYAFTSEEKSGSICEDQLTLLSNQIRELFPKIERINYQLIGMLSLKSLYELHKDHASLQDVDWYCGHFEQFGHDAIKNQGLLVYSGLLLFRECDDVFTHLEKLAIGNPLLNILCTIFRESYLKLKSSIIQAYNHLDSYGKYCFACYFYEINPKFFVGDCLVTDEIIKVNLELTAQAKRGLIDELSVALSL